VDCTSANVKLTLSWRFKTLLLIPTQDLSCSTNCAFVSWWSSYFKFKFE